MCVCFSVCVCVCVCVCECGLSINSISENIYNYVFKYLNILFLGEPFFRYFFHVNVIFGLNVHTYKHNLFPLIFHCFPALTRLETNRGAQRVPGEIRLLKI